jgi:1,4-alpha-glucan branching enzyme
MLANHLLHSLATPAVSIAEDVSGMPTLARPVWEGGVGFDFRLGMAVPDKWIQFLKEKSDDEWDMEQLVWTLTNRCVPGSRACVCGSGAGGGGLGRARPAAAVRQLSAARSAHYLSLPPPFFPPSALFSWCFLLRCPHPCSRWQEKTIAYAESHDQALVGDKTVAFWLMDKDMYWHMTAAESPRHPVVDRGLALHKMIRLITYALGGEGYLNFMGNEFGHPEWVDFPRAGNAWSYAYCRRQWNLVDDDALLYKPLAAWDGAMHGLEDEFPWLLSRDTFVSTKHPDDKVVAFDRWTRAGPLVFVFNFHPTKSFADYRIGVPCGGEWVVALDSDAPAFAGHGRVSAGAAFPAQDYEWNGRPASVQVYTPCRTVLVLKLKK